MYHLTSIYIVFMYKSFDTFIVNTAVMFSPKYVDVSMSYIFQIPDFLHESLAFGRTSDPAVASCQQMVRVFDVIFLFTERSGNI